MSTSNIDSIRKYPFLHDHIAKEPFMFDVLDEINHYQEQVIKSEAGDFATLESLKNSRNIKMPFTPSRSKNIAYITDVLAKTYPHEMRELVSFEFKIDPETKHLEIIEKIEYTVLMKLEAFNRFQNERDVQSSVSLINLLSKYRLFNLTKLIRKVKHRNDLIKIIKNEVGTTIFTYKNYTVDEKGMETEEEFCFHKDNYESVKKILDLESLKKIISLNSEPILRRLKKFGILNSEISNYRESKIDYILNILLEDISGSLSPKDHALVKNFQSVRSCMIKVDKILDPIITINNDIANQIKKGDITRGSSLLLVFDELTEELLKKWTAEHMDKHKIMSYRDNDGETYFIYSINFMKKLSELKKAVLNNPDDFKKVPQSEKNDMIYTLNLLCSAGRELISDQERAKQMLGHEENVHKLADLIREFEGFKKSQLAEKSPAKKEILHEKKSRKTLMQSIADFLKSLFSSSESESGGNDLEEKTGTKTQYQKKISQDSREIIREIQKRRSPLIPISDFIEINHENEMEIDRIIEEIRKEKLKIVVPIYNARANLYPKRSAKLLISDIEYLLVDIDIIQFPELITEFVNSLAGIKVKDETIPTQAISAIEKYLITLYRQKRNAHLLKK